MDSGVDHKLWYSFKLQVRHGRAKRNTDTCKKRGSGGFGRGWKGDLVVSKNAIQLTRGRFQVEPDNLDGHVARDPAQHQLFLWEPNTS